MPALGGHHPALPLHDGCTRLGAAGAAGYASQLVLLAVAGEAGYQRLLTDPGALVAHTGPNREVVALVALDLEAEGWIARGVWGATDADFPPDSLGGRGAAPGGLSGA